MSRFVLPFVVDMEIGGETHTNCPITKMNNKTVWVELPDGTQIKKHMKKDNMEKRIKFVSVK